MPIYEYECSKCGVIEVTQRITEDPLTKCPQCKRRKVKKLISNTSFQLKGSGWYVTDYGKSGADKGDTSSGSDASAGAEAKSSPDAGKSDGAKSESATAKKDSTKKDSKKKASKKAA